ncbi:MAG TPA: T9SS type A sorting domain-containing protein, partial [Bacteroidia bacterium]|nr:T9SS type A sorting domain-containing protein [Bacteroidia bacterium]
KAMIDVCQSNPQILYASIAEQLYGYGLYKSTDGGAYWTQVNPTDFQMHQGWYSHDVIVNPSDENKVITCGIDVWKSVDGGLILDQKSYWYNWNFNNTTIGGPEGPTDYVHADIHRMYYHPTNNNIIYLATDGGVFRSLDEGENFVSCNGGYQTQQFYANFSCSTTDSLFAIGGMQDNATAVYEGNAGWRRVIGGDGLSTAINPQDDQIVYGSYQYLNVSQSVDKAQSFVDLFIPQSSPTNFASPFVLCPSSPGILYAANDKVYKSIDEGLNWSLTNSNNSLDGNAVLALEVSDNNPDLVYAATAPVNIPQVGLFKTTNGGATWTNVTTGIPNRYIMDIAIDPQNNSKVYVAVSGFGTPHLFRSLNGGTNWTSFGNGLPDVPTNTITIDPLNTSIIYLGNDIGIYVSIDGGQNWQPFNDGLTDATFVMDISISPSNRKLRLATHGKGVYERDMLPVSITSVSEVTGPEFSIGPNPAVDQLTISYPNPHTNSELSIMDSRGKLIRKMKINDSKLRLDIKELKQGIYFLKIESAGQSTTAKFIKI